MNKEFREALADYTTDDEPIALFDGFDKAIIGVGQVHGSEQRVVYCYNKMVEIFAEENDCPDWEAMEYIDYNIVGAYIGVTTPFIMTMCTDKCSCGEW